MPVPTGAGGVRIPAVDRVIHEPAERHGGRRAARVRIAGKGDAVAAGAHAVDQVVDDRHARRQAGAVERGRVNHGALVREAGVAVARQVVGAAVQDRHAKNLSAADDRGAEYGAVSAARDRDDRRRRVAAAAVGDRDAHNLPLAVDDRDALGAASAAAAEADRRTDQLPARRSLDQDAAVLRVADLVPFQDHGALRPRHRRGAEVGRELVADADIVLDHKRVLPRQAAGAEKRLVERVQLPP